ncbi:uncharacterized protein BX664DRAFT_326584 [Halteromyces radiatus]|uniref:uncharacterized protein n=1 Tax=Halteromyces radiatus TaxID=101107 RepID=UPI00221F211F|nr:uncharacterized protein BX664DRAFT_326584 [Halteromyces radiatus]KAI8097512.1 hypothetical protein BX664DRAFT_326584 [Halteromyces radiatus]
MFRFENFRKPAIGTSTENATIDIGHDPLNSPSTDLTNEDNNDNSNKPPASFLQRIASSDTLFRPPHNKKSSTSNIHKSTSSSTLQSTSSFSIPIPSNSWGMKALSLLQDPDSTDYEDIIDLLLDGDRATLLLPVSRPTHPSVHIDLEFIKDHVIIYPPQQDRSYVMSLSGIRGAFKKDQFVALDLLTSEYESSSFIGRTEERKSAFDSFDLDPTSITPDHPVCNILATHVPVKLRGDKVISTMLIQKPLSRSEVMEWMRNRQHSRNMESSLTTSTSTEPSTSTTLDDPLAHTVNAFINAYRHRPPKTITMASAQWADFLDDLRDSMDTSTGQNIDDRLDIIETFMCRELYDRLFMAGSSDDSRQDEILESRIAAVNLLDLNLGHLGVAVDPSETESLNNMVKSAGSQLQLLNTLPGAKEKLDALVKTHQIIVDAIEEFATENKETAVGTNLEVIQEMKLAMSTVNDESSKVSISGESMTEQQRSGIDKDTSQQLDSARSTDDINISISDNQLQPKTTKTTTTTTIVDTHLNTHTVADIIPSSSPVSSDHSNLRTASADVLLPLLIFTIVKCNPTNFMSNLKFIQRFRQPSRLSGQASYCLTNILAAVSFLETTNLVGLGLSADKVHSNVIDLNAIAPTEMVSDPSNQQGSSSSSSAGGTGLKLVSDVMDSSYRVFDGIGRFWQQRNGTDNDNLTVSATMTSSAPTTAQVIDTNNKRHHSFSSLSPSELKDMATSVIGLSKSKKEESGTTTHREGINWENAVPGFLEQRKASLKPSISTSTSSSTSSRNDSFQSLLQAPAQFIQSVQQKSSRQTQHQHQQPYDGPLQKFLTMKSVDELTIGEIPELLADYKRLAAILKQSNLLQ